MLIHFVGPEAAKRRLGHRRASVRVAGGQQKRAKQDLTARLAASLSSNARATQRDGEASAAGSMDLNEREWESVDGPTAPMGTVSGLWRRRHRETSAAESLSWILHSPRTISCGRLSMQEITPGNGRHACL